MKNFNLLTISLYINFTICNAFSQVDASEPNNNRLDSQQNATIITNENKDDDDILYAPVKFTPEGLESFFKHKFNHPKYGEDYLPHNLTDIVQFLEYSKATDQDKRFIRTILRAFNQKFKSLSYLGGREFTQLIGRLPDLVDYSFIAQPTDEHTRVKNLLYNEFLHKYQFFKEDPTKFFTNLSEQICRTNAFNNIVPQDISSDELRSMILRFLETGISKVVWFIEDEPDIWTQFNETCQKIFKLKERNILYDYDDINDLIRGALDRFLFILDVRGSTLPIEFYEKVWTEIHNNPPSWMDIDELDEFIESKKIKLLHGIKRNHAKAIARSRYGLIS